jgi:hypothetical protein
MTSYWNSSGALIGDLDLYILRSSSAMRILRIRRLSDNSISNGISGDELTLTTVPFSQNLRGWSTPENARMDQSSKANMWDVSG